MTWQPQVTAELYDTDGTTSLGFLWASVDPGATSYRGASDCKWLTLGNGVGGATFKLGAEHPLADDVIDGRFVAFYIGTKRCFTMRVEGDPTRTESAPDDDVNSELTVKGRDWGCVTEDAAIKPEWGFGLPFNGSWRVWSFASIGYLALGNPFGGPVTELYEYRDGVTVIPPRRVVSQLEGTPTPSLVLYPAPLAWPWSEAPKNGNGFAPTPTYEPTYWVEADTSPAEDAVGYRFALGDFFLAGAQEVAIFVTADNLFRFFLDGVPILGELADTLVWQGWKQQGLVLPGGSHHVGVQWENIDAPALAFNPSAALVQVIAVAVYPGDTETSLTLSLFSSTASDMVASYFSADDWPGWSVGQIWGTWVPEVQAGGLLVPYNAGAHAFDGDVDANGDTWESLVDSLKYIPIFAMEIGRTGLDMLNRLYADGWANWLTRPDVLTVDFYNQSTTPADSGVELAFGPVGVGNIASPLKRAVHTYYANRLLVGWGKDKIVPVDDVAAQAAKGTVVEAMFQTDAASESEGIRRGLVELTRTTELGQPALVVDVIPTSIADAPYEAFDVFDGVTVPAAGGGTVLQACVGIGVKQRKDGTPEYQVYVNRMPRSHAEDQLMLFRSIGGKTMGSASDSLAGRVKL